MTQNLIIQKPIQLYKGDCLIESDKIESGSVDLILTDLPYGTVKDLGNSEKIQHGMKGKTEWDSVIPTDRVMQIANRILRKNGKMILTAQQPFTTELINSALPNLPFCYSMIWEKDHFANALTAKKAPLNYYEDILVFSKNHEFEGLHPLRPYFKKILDFISLKKVRIIEKIGQGADHCFRVNSSQFHLPTKDTYSKLILYYGIDTMNEFRVFEELEVEDIRFKNEFASTFNLWEGNKVKSNILKYKKDYDGYHTTQKPVLLLEDLIKTFSNENDLVVDLTMGSGSTMVACDNTNRRGIGIEIGDEHFNTAQKRVYGETSYLRLPK